MNSQGETVRGEQPLILVVEDDEATGRLLRNLLEPSGYRLAVASTAAAAWEFLSARAGAGGYRDAADLILLDLQLPDLDGAELVRRLGEGGTEMPPVVVCSAKTRESVAASAAAIEATAVVYKPFDIEELLARVATAVGR